MPESNEAEQFGGAFIALNLAISSLAVALHKAAPQIAEEFAKLLEAHAEGMRGEVPLLPALRQLESWRGMLRGESSVAHH